MSSSSAAARFAAFVAHELRTPIAVQRTLVEVALADPDADTSALREMGERVLASCIRQQRLIDALLDLSRSGRGLARQEPVDLAPLVREALRAHDLTGFERVVALAPAWTRGDAELVARLVGNLVSNAVRHNTVGGRVEVATSADAGRALFSVSNSGPPIPAGELPRLFQPFQRLASHPPDAGEGVGLGLAIVQAIADAHGATVTARARPAGGLAVDVGFLAAARPRRTRVRAAAALIATVGIVAGCGSPGSDVAQLASPGSGAVAFAGCMRSNGVSKFPDPGARSQKPSLQQLGVSSSRFQSAQRACQHLLPNGGQPPNRAQLQQIGARGLRFARCVRAHGVPSFPDPASTGRIPDPASVGVDQGSPAFRAANQACREYRPPYIPSNAAYDAWARAHAGSG